MFTKNTMASRPVNLRLLAFLTFLILALARTAVAAPAPDPQKSEKFYNVLQSMARVYMAYGKYDKAQPLAEQAVNFAKNANLSDEQLCLSMLD